MGFIDSMIEYKNKAMSDIVHNPVLVEALDKEYICHPDDLIYRNIFPYKRYPIIADQVTCYIGVVTSIPKVYNDQSYLYRSLTLTFYVVCHQNLMETNYGATRVDYISREIEKMFSENSDYGFGKMQFINSDEYDVGPNFRGRYLSFNVQSKKGYNC